MGQFGQQFDGQGVIGCFVEDCIKFCFVQFARFSPEVVGFEEFPALFTGQGVKAQFGIFFEPVAGGEGYVKVVLFKVFKVLFCIAVEVVDYKQGLFGQGGQFFRQLFILVFKGGSGVQVQAAGKFFYKGFPEVSAVVDPAYVGVAFFLVLEIVSAQFAFADAS